MEHTADCQCERCILLDEIMKLAKELKAHIITKLSGEYILPEYWGKKERQQQLLERLRKV